MLSNVSFHPETRFPDNKIVTKSKEAGSIITLYLNFEDDERKTFPARESTFRLVQHPRTTELDDIIKLWCCFQPLSCIKKQPPPKKKKKTRKKERKQRKKRNAPKKRLKLSFHTKTSCMEKDIPETPFRTGQRMACMVMTLTAIPEPMGRMLNPRA